MHFNKNVVNLGWKDFSIIKHVNLNDKISYNSAAFPLDFYPKPLEFVVGLKKLGEEIKVYKYYFSSTESVNKVLGLDPQEIGNSIPQDYLECLYDVKEKKFLDEASFITPLPPRDRDFCLGFSKTWKQLLLFPSRDLMGLLAAMNITSIYLSKPVGSNFTETSKRFLYNWVCLNYSYKFNKEVKLENVDFPGNKGHEVRLPDKDSLTFLTSLSDKLLKGELIASSEPPEDINKNGDLIEPLSSIIKTGGIDENLLETSDFVDVQIFIDVQKYNFVTDAYLCKRKLTVCHIPNAFKSEVNEFFDLLKMDIKKATVILEHNYDIM